MKVRAARTLLTTVLTGLVLAVAVLAPGPALAGPSTTHGAEARRSALSVAVRIGTYNIRAGVSQEDFESGVDAFRPKVDVAGLQEIAQRPKHWYLQEAPGWGYYVPPQQIQNPVIWDQSKLELVGGSGVLLAKGRDIGDEKPEAGEFRKDAYATVVHLRHLLTGQVLTVINVHLLAGAVSNAKFRADRPLMVSFYKDQVRSLDKLVAAEALTGKVVVLGDFNVGYVADARFHRPNMPYARLTAHDLVSMWRDCPTDGKGTHGPQYIDQIWTDQPVSTCEVAYEVKDSDHYPVVGTYALDLVPGWTP